MADTAHTPTPWQLEGKYKGDRGSIYLSTMHPSPVFELVPLLGKEETHLANAAHIVKCVNENEALHKRIAILQEALETVADYDKGATAGLAYTAKVALAKAGEA